MNVKTAWACVAVMAAVGSGCKPIRDRIRDALATSVASDAAWASNVCGYQVQGLTNVSVTGVSHGGTPERGTGSATVGGTPVPVPGMQVAGACGATVTFNYAAGAGDSLTERLTSSDLHVRGLLVTGRLAGAPPVTAAGTNPSATVGNPTPPYPVAVPSALPVAPTGTSTGTCARYQSCCVAASAMPGMQGLAASCAQIGGLASMGAYGEQACSQAWDALHRAMSTMRNSPPACR